MGILFNALRAIFYLLEGDYRLLELGSLARTILAPRTFRPKDFKEEAFQV